MYKQIGNVRCSSFITEGGTIFVIFLLLKEADIVAAKLAFVFE
jgi:hypothetical protein